MSDLHDALDALIQPSRRKVTHDDGTHTWHTIPSLWEQLAKSAGWKGGNTGSGAYSSRPVISTSAVSLVIEIETTITEAATDYGRIITQTRRIPTCYCKPHRHCPGYINTTERNHPAELQAITANIPTPELTDWWTTTLRTWTHQARETLGLNPPRPQWARGTPCPTCHATHATTTIAGEPARTPALAILWAGPHDNTNYHEDDEYKVRAVECRACGTTWFRGDSLEALVEQLFAA